MALNIAELILFGLIADFVFKKLKMPGLIGMLFLGVVIGPYVLGVLNPGLLNISSDLRIIALIVILLRAGFELSKDTLHKVGVRAILLSFIPATLEGIAIVFLAHRFLGLSLMESAILGAVLSAVSPAVVVPLMIRFMEARKGAKKGIPTLILAASSIDDVFVIVVYSVLIGIYTGQKMNIAWKLAGIPISIVSGVLIGLVCGFALYKIFDKMNPRATKRLLIILGISIVFVNIEHRIESFFPFASLLAVMAIGFIILEKSEYMAHEISAKLNKLWVFAEIVLFTLVGAQVNLRVAVASGAAGAAVIFLALIARSIGTYGCLMGSDLTMKERMFVVISYVPKATVQAAIGGAPLVAMKLAGMNTQPGEIILATAVLSIILTAPLGAWAISYSGNKILEVEPCCGDKEHAMTREDILGYFTVGQVMEKDVVTLREAEKVYKVFEHFSANDFFVYPVADSAGCLAGVIRLEDMRAILQEHDSWKWLVAKDVMTPFAQTIYASSSLREGLTAVRASHCEQIPVVEKNSRKTIGVFDVRKAEKFIERKMFEVSSRKK
jgi:NhaP-type Na+/H+ or K+/H+ antiporter/predicted transcriptional regulator